MTSENLTESYVKNIILQFDDSSLASLKEVLEDHLDNVTKLLSLEGSDDIHILSNTLTNLEKEHCRATKDSIAQVVSMVESLKKIVTDNLNELIEFERRIDSAENVLAEFH